MVVLAIKRTCLMLKDFFGQLTALCCSPLPFQVPLEIESITAVVDGARVQAFPTSVLLPPRAEFHEVRRCCPEYDQARFGRVPVFIRWTYPQDHSVSAD